MFGIGAGEFILILVVGLIVFGPSQLPSVGRSLGKAIREFRKAQSALSTALNDIDTEPVEHQQKKVEPVEPKRTTVDDVTIMINTNPISVDPIAAKPLVVDSAPDKINLSKTDAVKES